METFIALKYVELFGFLRCAIAEFRISTTMMMTTTTTMATTAQRWLRRRPRWRLRWRGWGQWRCRWRRRRQRHEDYDRDYDDDVSARKGQGARTDILKRFPVLTSACWWAARGKLTSRKGDSAAGNRRASSKKKSEWINEYSTEWVNMYRLMICF